MAVVADKRTEGKFLAQYWDRTNTRVTPSFATRERAEFDMMINAGDMSLHLLGDIHFSGLMLYYEHVQKQRLLKDAKDKGRTEVDRVGWARVKAHMKLFEDKVEPILRDLKISEIDTDHFVLLRQKLQRSHALSTVNNCLGQVRLALRMAADRDAIDMDPITRAQLKKRGPRRRGSSGPADRGGVADPILAHHLERIRAACRTHELVCVDMMSQAGATLAEANAVAEANIDLRGRRISFSQELVLSRIRDLPDPKSHRTVVMTNRLAATLIRAIVLRRQSGDLGRRLVPTAVVSPTLGLVQARAGLNAWPGGKGMTAKPTYTATRFKDFAVVEWCEAPKRIGLMAIAERLGVRTHAKVKKRYGKHLNSRDNRSQVAAVNDALARLKGG